MGILVRNVQKSFGDPPTHVLHDLNFEIESGEFVALTGRSGSGKSTLLYILSTLDTPSAGVVEVDGAQTEQLTSKEIHRFRNLNMGFIFQFHYLLPELTALENVLMPAMKTGQEGERTAAGKKLLSDFGLGDKFHRFPSQLSGGEQQRVAIARSLIMDPKYLFADEPTGNLDTASGDVVMDILARTNQERHTTIIYVTHDTDYASRAKRQLQLIDGRLAAS